MGLTSGSFQIVIIAAAVASIAATVWLWPHVARRGLAHLAARLGLIAFSQALVIAAFLVYLNGYFSFFGSWAQLVGSDTPRPVAMKKLATAATRKPIVISGVDLGPVPGGSVLPVRADGHLAAHPPSSRRPGRRSRTVLPRQLLKRGLANAATRVGEVLQVTVRGERTGLSDPGFVYLPPQYFQSAYSRARFPVVLVLTGYPNDAWSIVRRLAVPATAARMVAGKRIAPAVYVMLNASPVLPRDTECTNVPAGPQVETFFADDVPLAVQRTFRVRRSGSAWGVIGYSTGGYCAAKLAMLNPRQFPAAVSMAGYYYALRDATTGNIYGGSRAYRDENSLDWRLAHLPAPPVSVLVTSSRIGEVSYPGTLAFLHLIHAPMHGYSLILPQGGHNYRTWNRELPQSLEWLVGRIAPARSLPRLPRPPQPVSRQLAQSAGRG